MTKGIAKYSIKSRILAFSEENTVHVCAFFPHPLKPFTEMRQSDELTKSASLVNNFTFSRTISREVLENYLSRAVTAQDVVKSDTLDDDIRMLTNIGAKFIGRAGGPTTAGWWSLCLTIMRRGC